MNCPLCGFHVNAHSGRCQNGQCSYVRPAAYATDVSGPRLPHGMTAAQYDAYVEEQRRKSQEESDRQWAQWEAEDAAKKSRAVEALRKVTPEKLFGVLAR